MQSSFYIKENRLSELKSFIRKFTPTVRFNHNPLKIEDELFISLTMEVEDGNKLNELFNKWHGEDFPPENSKPNYFKQFLNIFK